MDAMTSFELEAQRRRETIASDRDQGWARMKRSTEAAEVATEPATRRIRPTAQGDCQPAPLARNSAA